MSDATETSDETTARCRTCGRVEVPRLLTLTGVTPEQAGRIDWAHGGQVWSLPSDRHPCSRCGEVEVINPHPGAQIVCCEMCAFAVAEELAASKLRQALDATHRQGEWKTRRAVLGIVEQLESEPA